MSDGSTISFTTPAYHNIILSNKKGQQAVIDFSGDIVTFSGELPVDEAAQLFFQYVGHYLK